MAQSLTGTIVTTMNPIYTNTLDNELVTSALAAAAKTRTQTYANGTGANQVQQMWSDERTLTTTTSETLDLSALAGGAFGTVNFSKIKEIIIQVTTATSGFRLLVGGGSTNPFTAFVLDPSDKIYVGAGGQVHLSNPVDGYTVDGTHKILTLENPSGGSLTYKITLIGVGSVA